MPLILGLSLSLPRGRDSFGPRLVKDPGDGPLGTVPVNGDALVVSSLS